MERRAGGWTGVGVGDQVNDGKREVRSCWAREEAWGGALAGGCSPGGGRGQAGRRQAPVLGAWSPNSEVEGTSVKWRRAALHRAAPPTGDCRTGHASSRRSQPVLRSSRRFLKFTC